MHVDERDEVALAAQQQKRRNLDASVFFVAVRVATIVVDRLCQIVSQKPYPPSLDEGSLRTMVPKTCSHDRRCMSTNGMK
jgi:hypothetical protein